MAELSIYSILIILEFLDYTILLGENSYMQKMRMDVYMGIRYYDLEYILKCKYFSKYFIFFDTVPMFGIPNADLCII